MKGKFNKIKIILLVAVILHALCKILNAMNLSKGNQMLEILTNVFAIIGIILYIWASVLIFTKGKTSHQNKIIQKNEEKKQSMSKEEVNRRVELISNALTTKTKKSAVKFELLKEKPQLFDSKIGGEYFIPAGFEQPINKETGNPLYLLAQINFSQMPKLEDFPDEGLLQIFIAGDDDAYGLFSKEGYKVLYYPEVPKNTKKGKIFNPEWNNETYMPMEKTSIYKLVGEKTTQEMSVYDENFDSFIEENFKELLTEVGYRGNKHIGYEVMDKIEASHKSFRCQCGGYPTFTQSDPRNIEDENFEDILLFQLDTYGDIMWGDSGVGNFFISKKDLKNKDFSKVRYNWDCC